MSVVAAWFVVGSGGAFSFILIQLVLLVDFAHSWNESWVDRMETGNPRGWYAGQWLKTWSSCSQEVYCFNENVICWSVIDLILYLLYSALLGVTIFNYILSFIAIVLFFVFYTTPGGCYINKFFISFNMLFCVVASIISVLPKVQVQDVLLCSTCSLFMRQYEALLRPTVYSCVLPRSVSRAQGSYSPPSSPCTPCFWPGLPWAMSPVRVMPTKKKHQS